MWGDTLYIRRQAIPKFSHKHTSTQWWPLLKQSNKWFSFSKRLQYILTKWVGYLPKCEANTKLEANTFWSAKNLKVLGKFFFSSILSILDFTFFQILVHYEKTRAVGVNAMFYPSIPSQIFYVYYMLLWSDYAMLPTYWFIVAIQSKTWGRSDYFPKQKQARSY